MKIYQSIFILSASFMIFNSCKKDSTDSNCGEFILKGDKYELSNAELYNLGYILSDGNGAAYQLSLFPSGVTTEKLYSGEISKCYMIVMDLYTPNKDKIIEGTYNFDANKKEMPFYFDYAFVNFFENLSHKKTWDDITDGSIRISVNGDII